MLVIGKSVLISLKQYFIQIPTFIFNKYRAFALTVVKMWEILLFASMFCSIKIIREGRNRYY